ncbi:TPA: 3-hydroxyacyl-CoA dehydrogenase PaaC [Raoultella ornithinolytica]|nr:3-hydroxyacyl-CoA dehydrogenase PaaC [Raoultella ornithinolytica]
MSQTLQTVAVIGAGTMGAGIAEVAAAAGHPVLLYDIAAEALTRAVEGIRQRLAARVARGKLTADQADALVARLVPVTELAALSDAWLVIEAASERPDVKKALFNQLAAICSPSTLLTSNTSSISITAIAADVSHPERVAGLHFFNPAPVMKLVEVVSGLATSPEVVEQLCRCVAAWGKQPVRCRSTPGFIVNRVARPFYAEAWRALEEQVAPPAVIDAALRDGGGFPMGPLALTDLIGQDVNFAVTCSVFNAFWQDRRFLPSLVQQELALAGRLGKKSGQGVYRWPIESASVPALAAVAETRGAKTVCTTGDSVTGRVAIALDDVRLLETEGETAQALSVRYGCPVVVYDYCAGDTVVLATAATNPASATDKAVRYFQQQGKKVLLIADYPGLLVWRTLAMLINEALDAVQKGVASPEDIDTAMRLGVNYPHGPLAWGESLGWQRVLRLLENLQQHYGEERYRPGSLLRQKALVEKRNEQ